MIGVMSLLPRTPRGITTAILAAIAWLTTFTVVEKCTTTHIMTIHTELPARVIAQAGHGTVIASARLILPTRDTIIVHDTIATTRVITRTILDRSTQPAIIPKPTPPATLPPLDRPPFGITPPSLSSPDSTETILNPLTSSPPGKMAISYVNYHSCIPLLPLMPPAGSSCPKKSVSITVSDPEARWSWTTQKQRSGCAP